MSKTIYVYAICKNEEQFARRWMNSMQEADGVYVLDTGSSDETPRILSSLGAHVCCETVSPWRFDSARNRSLALLPEDADLCVCTDLDECFHPGWRKAMEEALDEGVQQLSYRYTWSFLQDGAEGHVFWQEKAHRRQGFEWTGAVHEVLRYTGSAPFVRRFAEGVQLDHFPDPKKSRGQYLPLLELAVSEDPHNDRNMHYLGREYMFKEQWEKAIETLEKHLALPSSLWADERCASMRFLARCHSALGHREEAERWLLRACAEAPHLREPWMDAANHFYVKQNWDAVVFFSRQALGISQRGRTYITEPESWGALPYDLCSLGLYYTGQYASALQMAQKALELSPEDSRIQENLRFMHSALCR